MTRDIGRQQPGRARCHGRDGESSSLARRPGRVGWSRWLLRRPSKRPCDSEGRASPPDQTSLRFSNPAKTARCAG